MDMVINEEDCPITQHLLKGMYKFICRKYSIIYIKYHMYYSDLKLLIYLTEISVVNQVYNQG